MTALWFGILALHLAVGAWLEFWPTGQYVRDHEGA